jgi:hypothetical protein
VSKTNARCACGSGKKYKKRESKYPKSKVEDQGE